MFLQVIHKATDLAFDATNLRVGLVHKGSQLLLQLLERRHRRLRIPQLVDTFLVLYYDVVHTVEVRAHVHDGRVRLCLVILQPVHLVLRGHHLCFELVAELHDLVTVEIQALGGKASQL